MILDLLVYYFKDLQITKLIGTDIQRHHISGMVHIEQSSWNSAESKSKSRKVEWILRYPRDRLCHTGVETIKGDRPLRVPQGAFYRVMPEISGMLVNLTLRDIIPFRRALRNNRHSTARRWTRPRNAVSTRWLWTLAVSARESGPVTINWAPKRPDPRGIVFRVKRLTGFLPFWFNDGKMV